MPKVNHISDVYPYAITLCKQGANGKRIFLAKEKKDETPEMVLPSGDHEFIAKQDRSAIYCVVAEPGAMEECGLTGDPEVPDTWAGEEEIRKAAHRFAKSEQLVNAFHDSLEPFGAVVENAVALDDFTVVDPTGVAQQIKKGSWYVAIEPTEDGWTAFDNGEITGVSMEGTGIRTLIEKSKKDERTILQKIRDLVGSEQEPLAKSTPSFAGIIAQAAVQDQLWVGFDALRQAIRESVDPDNDVTDPAAAISQSADEFAVWLKSLAAGVKGNSEPLQKELATLNISTDEEETDVAVDDKTFEDFKKSQTEAIDRLSGLVENLVGKITEAKDDANAEGGEGGEGKTSAADLKKSLDKFAEKLDGIDGELVTLAKSINDLEDGGSTQEKEPDTIRKSNDNPLAGLLA